MPNLAQMFLVKNTEYCRMPGLQVINRKPIGSLVTWLVVVQKIW